MKTSAYKIYWAEFTPTTGKVVTKHDRKQFGEVLCNYTGAKTYRKHFPNKEAALDYVKNFEDLGKKFSKAKNTKEAYKLASKLGLDCSWDDFKEYAKYLGIYKG